MKANIKIKPLREGARLPSYGSNGAAGADLHACLSDPVTLYPGRRAIIPAGFAMELPDDFEAQIRSRSGIAIKRGVVVLNAPGTIDSDYRGEVGVMLVNHGDDPFIITHGDRIAQMILAYAPQVGFDWTMDIDETERGESGYGSTGVAAE